MPLLQRLVHQGDVVRFMNGLQVKDSAFVRIDGEAIVVEERPARVDAKSTRLTVVGSVVAFLVWGSLASMTYIRFLTGKPTVSELLVEPYDRDDPPLSMPDIAITMSVPNMAELDLLAHVWPIFTWANIEEGFTNRANTFEPMDDIKFGDECRLRAGYNFGDAACLDDADASAGCSDGGAAKWPVFCIINSTRKLQGRFGDKSWSFPSISLNRCGKRGAALSKRLNDSWWESGGGSCHPNGTDALPIAVPNTLPMNVWFRFPREEWENHRELQEPHGMVGPGNWTWWIYQVLPIKTDGSEGTKILAELRHNNATVNDPWTLWDAIGRKTHHAWFSFDGWEHSPTGTSSSDFQDAPILGLSLRVAWRRRQITVRYLTVQQAISEMSGSWTASMVFGALFFFVVDSMRKTTDGNAKARVVKLKGSKVADEHSAANPKAQTKQGVKVSA